MKLTVRHAQTSDYGAFIGLWEAFLKEREAHGSAMICSEELLRYATDLFYRITMGRTPGVCLIAPQKGVNLWGPELPFPTRYGRTLIAQGTFVREEFRQKGLAWKLYEEGLASARAQGFDAVLSSVDAGNTLSERNAGMVGFEDVQVSKIVPTRSA